MDAEQYYQSVQRDLPEDHATLQGWKQEKRNDNEWGTEEDLLWEDTWKGTADAFLEAAAETYPRPPGDTRHGLHALLAFHSWKHRHTVTLHPLDHNPHRWTPEDDATAAITVQQSPENPEEYHITWNDPAPHPPASPTLPDVFATISAELQEAKAPQQLDEEMPQAPSPPTTQDQPRTEPLAHPITTMELPPHTAPPQTETGFETCRGNGRSTTAHSDGTKSHRASRPSASTRSPSPPPPGHYRRTATTSSSPSKAMPRSNPRRETP